jgi:SPP1 family predicted phage head-tail adaptor
MRPGKLDQRITIQEYSEVSDGAGGLQRAWADLSSAPSVWAHVVSAAGTERFEEDRTSATSGAVFTIRNRTDLNERMRIEWAGRFYNIRQLKPISSRAMYLKIVAESGAASGG